MSSATYATPGARFAARGGATGAGVGQRGRRLVAVTALVAMLFAVMVVIDRGGAQASLEHRVAEHVVVQPGETLWDVAVTTAPDGVDPRQQLADLRDLNGLRDGHVDQWAVILIPAR